MSGPGALTSAVPERPGTSYYKPGVRVARMQPKLQKEGERGTLLPKSVLGDLVRAQVTRVNSGVSQYSLTFNNWYLSTGFDRQQQLDDLGDGTAREAIDASSKAGAPFWPRFKYNDFALLSFGDRLRIDMRYVPEPTGTARSDAEEEQTWTPMICGPVTDISFEFATGQGAQLVVSGEDDLSRLKDKHDKRVPMDRRAEISIVRQALEKAKYPLTFARPLVGYPDFVSDDGQGIQEALGSGQSTLDLIQKLAARLDFEVFVEFASLDQPSSRIEFHFEPYRGRAKPDEKLRPIFRLDRERNLLHFSPTIKVVDQYSKVEVKGRHRDPVLAREVKGEATHTILADELHVDTKVDGVLKSGPEVRSKFFPDRENPGTVPNQSNLDEVRANWAARAVIRKKARELVTIEATTLGVPRIRPGRHIEIRGLRPPFDGFYYITKTVHTFGADGYRTKITASRPGMELAPYKQGGSQ